MAEPTAAACSKARWASRPEADFPLVTSNADKPMRFLRLTALPLATLAALAVLSACQSKPPEVNIVSSGKSASLRAMEVVATAAHKCWFAAKDPAFKPYKFANELNAFGGQPRFLLVPARNYGGKPLLVVQATGASSKVHAFGPLLSEPLGGRVTSDLTRWSAGDTSCSAAA